MSLPLPLSFTPTPKNTHANDFKSKEEAQVAASAFQSSLPLLSPSDCIGNVVLITGGNKGIGYEVARQLGAKGMKVLVGCRDSQRGKEAEKKLREQNKDASFQFVQLDVDSSESIAAAVEAVSSLHGRLDVLVNNAAIIPDWGTPSNVDGSGLRKALETNLVGPTLIVKAFLPLLEKSANARIVNVSSGLGLHEVHRYPDGIHVDINVVGYCASKAALNLYTVMLANEQLAKKSTMRVNVVCPGYTATDLNYNRGPQTVAEGAESVVVGSLIAPHGPTGAFFNRFGFFTW